MPKNPYFRKNYTLAQTVGSLRRPGSVPETGWHGVTEIEIGPGYLNDWIAASGSSNTPGVGTAMPGWMLDEHGDVRLRGNIDNADPTPEGTVAFTLPEDVRPEYDTGPFTLGMVQGGYANVWVYATGDVFIQARVGLPIIE